MKLRGLYAVTPEAAGITDKVRRALEGGVALLQYRSKTPELAQAREIAALARAYGVPFIVNDDVGLALELGADGAHLGREDEDLRSARKKLAGKILGASCYASLEAARAAVAHGVDYVAFGSVFASSTKPQAARAPLELFAEARVLGVPLCAIGGITLERAPSVIAAGADLLAVVSDLFDAPDIARRAKAYARLFQ